jgi:hypothetical protein
MFKFFKRDKVVIEVDIRNGERLEKQDACLHKRFYIYGHNMVGDATCLDCGKTYKMYVFYNSLLNRLIDLEKKLEDKLNNLR